MGKSLKDKLSARIKVAKRSTIRELLKLLEQPDIISFAGGMPDPALFPVNLIKEACDHVLTNHSEFTLQYGSSEGYLPLRQELIRRIETKEKTKVSEDEIIVTVGSQQGLDLVAKILLNYGDIVIVEEPTYLGGLQAFRSYGGRFIGIPCDETGMQVELIEDKLKELGKHEIKRIKFVYVVPDFQNPGGRTLSLERRKKLIALAEKYDFLIVEDSPYKELRYCGEHKPSLFSLAPRGRVVMLCTFSKLFCPGFRLAYAIGDKDVIFQMVTGKQATDLCTPAFNQAVLSYVLKKNALDPHIEKLISAYHGKQKCMLNSLDKYIPPLGMPSIEWTKPDGGLFLWMTMPEYIDTERMLSRAIENKIAYVTGTDFFHDSSVKNCMRLNFSMSSVERIEEGIRRLVEVINAEK
ncbi:MAG: PLP-dependent aminotransferase family protein [bacterium]|nr:PLP-dependent aminotransferase family protein [bacterium]